MVRPRAATRVELEGHPLVDRTADEEFLRRITNRVAEVEQKLREIDE
jgi:hypothetical protein